MNIKDIMSGKFLYKYKINQLENFNSYCLLIALLFSFIGLFWLMSWNIVSIFLWLYVCSSESIIERLKKEKE